MISPERLAEVAVLPGLDRYDDPYVELWVGDGVASAVLCKPITVASIVAAAELLLS